MINEKLKKEWGDNYIDLLALSSADEDGSVIAFSEDHKLISQDTHHLTRGGARYFAQKIDFETIFRN